MDTLEEAIVSAYTKPEQREQHCCNRCANKTGTQNAHCGKIYAIVEGKLQETKVPIEAVTRPAGVAGHLDS
ncbi:hypothetical protein EXU57_09515 [Segetibacter sp. 3557_3]|uniref:hypothetical protein n=1 Tax=Segetibacter sp. 3557_3 TaxID=2547429 RepID=UPI0010589035|nr:hypothetical protein [Segetibacter sp. 3557_3]TDH27027.1 hypothetical protein EXU57_09515 [Segetibacter sp. 3557_3]